MNDPSVRRASAMPAGTPEVPVAIVGAGACGLTAAIALRDAGIDCVLLERDAMPRGSTALSSGFIPAAGTAVQRAAGEHDDDPVRFAVDIQSKARGSAAPHLVSAYAEAIGPALDVLQQRHGLAFELLDGFLYPGHTRHRMHTLPQRTGAALVQALDAAAARAGATLLTNALVRELWCDAQDRVLGVGFVRPDGRVEHLACQVLLLACNGFGGNAAMVREWLPEMRDAVFAGHAGNDGSAIAWGRALGAGLADMQACQGHGSWAVPQGVLITWALMSEGGVQVNAQGRRFHDERLGYSEASVQVLAQPGGIAWDVFDTRLLALARGFPDFVEAEAAGALQLAPDVASLAARIGCEAAALRETLAAGGAARGVSGDALWGYLSGNGLLSAVAGGAIAARTAARQLGEHDA